MDAFRVSSGFALGMRTLRASLIRWKCGVLGFRVVYGFQPEVGAMKSASAVDVPSDRRPKRQKNVKLPADAVHVPDVLEPKWSIRI